MKQVVTLHKYPIKWLHRKLSPFQFLSLSAIIVGASVGLAAVALKSSVHYINKLLTDSFIFHYDNLWVPLSPLVGILLTVLVVLYFLKGKDGKGIAGILHEIARKSSKVPKYKMYSQWVTSAITVGLGGSSGLEGPISVTGAAIGSNFGRVYHVNYKDRTILLAAGAAAGISAMFNAPITGVMFAVEVLLAGVAIMEFIPLIMAAATGALVSMILLNDGIILSFQLVEPFNYYNIPFYIALGLLCGGFSLYYARVSLWMDKLFHLSKRPRLIKALIGGILLSVLIFLFPPLFGEGYETIMILANGEGLQLFENSILAEISRAEWALLVFIGIIGFIKVWGTSLTLASGGSGGNFAPSLFSGAFLGYFFAAVINSFNWVKLPAANFTLVGMAGILSGVFYAPLTAVFLIAEITGGYQLFIPLMLVSALAFFFARQIEPYSMETRRLAKKGEIFTGNKDHNVLTQIKLEHVLEKDVQVISPAATLGELVKLIRTSRRNLFAVLNEAEQLMGIITLETVKDVMFDEEKYNDPITPFIKQPPYIVDIAEDMKEIMQKFDASGSWNLPVTKKGKYAGFVSKSTLLNHYRGQLKKH